MLLPTFSLALVYWSRTYSTEMIYGCIVGVFRGTALLTQSLIQIMYFWYRWCFPWHCFTDPEPNQYDVWWYYWRFPWCKTSVQWYVLLSQPSASTTWCMMGIANFLDTNPPPPQMLLMAWVDISIYSGKRTEWSAIRSVIIRSDYKIAVVRFVNHEYD